MGAPDGGRVPPPDDPLQEQAQLLQAPVELLRALSRQLPVLLLIEDAHWIDPTTEQLGLLGVELARATRACCCSSPRARTMCRRGERRAT